MALSFYLAAGAFIFASILVIVAVLKLYRIAREAYYDPDDQWGD